MAAQLHQRARCSAPGGDFTGERRRLCRARWGGGVLSEMANDGGAEKTARTTAFQGGCGALVAGVGVDESCSWWRRQGR
jgi:hypothetical protein